MMTFLMVVVRDPELMSIAGRMLRSLEPVSATIGNSRIMTARSEKRQLTGALTEHLAVRENTDHSIKFSFITKVLRLKRGNISEELLCRFDLVVVQWFFY